MEATNTKTIEDAARIALGRPQVGKGPPPVLRVRIPHEVKSALTDLAESRQRKESEIVREALIAYLKAHLAS